MAILTEQPASGPEPTAVELGLEAADKPRSMFARGWEVFAENKLALASLIALIVIAGFGFLGPLFYHGNYTKVDAELVTMPPSAAHPLGTDQYGLDYLEQLMRGTAVSLDVGLAAGLIAAILGAFYGAVAGYAGGWLDSVMMRIIDAFMSFPLIFVLIYINTVYGKSQLTLIIEIGCTAWFGITRLVRGEALAIKVRDYVAASKMMGGKSTRIIYKHILPNAIGTSIVNTTFSIADAVFALSVLSFIGLGLQAPSADLGGLLDTGTQYASQGYWWLVYPPAVIIIAIIMAFNIIGDALRDAFETRLQKR